MKQDQKTLNTKKALAASLKKFMKQKPLSKITVSQLISDCNVNRKTFYYHFEDIYDLLKWTLEEEAIEVVKQYDLLVDYQEVITFVMDYVEENQHILNCAYDSLGREGMKRFLYADFIGILSTLIEGIEQQENIHADAEFKQFLCEFYTEALSGILISCPAVSSSVWHLPARSSLNRPASCLTSRFPHWTHCCGKRCARNCGR